MTRRALRPLGITLGALVIGCVARVSNDGGAGGDGGFAATDGGDAGPAATAGGDAGFTVSQQLVFMMTGGPPPGPTTSSEIGLVNLDGTGLRQLTNDGKYKFLPHFSPDGTRIAYTRFETAGYGSPNATADVAVFNLATQTEKMITRGGANVQGTWSPDGNAIAFLSGTAAPGQGISVSKILIVSADGGSPQEIGAAAGTPTDMFWGDIAWSSGSGWILFTVAQNPDGGCFNVRTDKILPDGGSRTQVTNGGPNCTPPGWEQSGDADPGWSSDGLTIYSSRGFPFEPLGAPDGGNPIACRKLYSFPSDAWFPGKVENDLSLPAVPNCIEGVPKGSPDGTRVLLYRACLDAGTLVAPGTYVTDTAGSYRTFVIAGFGADWNPVAQ